jgi:hypothetical protein
MSRIANGEKVRAIKDCFAFLRKYSSTLHPSFQCTLLVDESNMYCICYILNEHDDERIRAEKMVHIVRLEGEELETGKKCGSKFIILF